MIKKAVYIGFSITIFALSFRVEGAAPIGENTNMESLFRDILTANPDTYSPVRAELIDKGNKAVTFLRIQKQRSSNWYERVMAETLIHAIVSPRKYEAYQREFNKLSSHRFRPYYRIGAGPNQESTLITEGKNTVPFLIEKLFKEAPFKIRDTTRKGWHSSTPVLTSIDLLKHLGGKDAARAVAVTILDSEDTGRLHSGKRRGTNICKLAELSDTELVDSMIKCLKNPLFLPMAAWPLGEFKDPKSIDPLIESLKDYDVNKYLSSAEALAKFGESAIPALINALSHPRRETRSWADHALKKIGSAALPALSRYLDEGPSVSHYHAVRAIRFIADPQGVPALIKALESKDSRVVGQAAQGLGEIGDPAAKEPLLKALENPRNWHSSGTALFGITDALARFKEKRAFDRLAKLSRDDQNMVSSIAIRALPAVDRDKALPLLLELIRHEHKTKRIKAAFALGELRDPNAVPALINSLSDTEFSVRAVAALSLGEIGDIRALPSLRRARDSGDKDVKRTASEAIKKIQKNAKKEPDN